MAPLLALALLAASTLPAYPGAADPVPGPFSTVVPPTCDGTLPCLKWAIGYEGPMKEARTHGAVLSADGTTAYVVGAYNTPDTFTDVLTMAIDVPTGAIAWTARYDGPAHSMEGFVHTFGIRHVALSPDGQTVVVATASQGTNGLGLDIATIAYSATDGTELWSQRYNGPGSNDDYPVGVVVDSTGGFVVTAGDTEDDEGFGSWVAIGYDLATGAQVWTRTFSNACSEERLFGMQQAPAGTVVLGGMTTACMTVETDAGPVHQSLGFEVAAARLQASTGDVLWHESLGDPLSPAASVWMLGSIAVADGRVHVTGGLTRPGNTEDMDPFMVTYDLAGQLLWSARHDSGGHDEPLGSVAGGGRLHLVTMSPALGTGGVSDLNPDIVALAFDAATGAPLWSRHFDGSEPAPLAPEPFAATATAALGTGRDSATLVQPILVANGTRLVLAYDHVETPFMDTVGNFGDREHNIVLVDTADGTVRERVQGSQSWEYVFASAPGRPDFLALGFNGTFSDADATVRHFTLDAVPPVLQLPGDLAAEATSAAGAVVSFQATAWDAVDGAVATTCSHAPGAFPLGGTTVSCQASDISGNVASGTFVVTVEDTTAPTLALPAGVVAAATSTAGAPVQFDASAADAVDGTLAPTCSPASGTAFPLGTTRVSCSVADGRGNAAAGTFDVQVTYSWSGLQGAIQDGAVLKGRFALAQFSLTGASAGITDATARVWVSPAAGGPEVPAVPKGALAGNVFQWSGTDYTFQWDTRSLPPGVYDVRVDLGDGTGATARVTLA